MRIFTGLLFGSLVGVTISLECFHCSDCDRETAQIKTCHSVTAQCYSLLGPVTKRGCAYRCPFSDEEVKEECHMCTEDLCNHHQQEHHHVLKPAPATGHHRHHRGTRHRREEKDKKVLVATHYRPDGTKYEHYENPDNELPPLPQEGPEDIIQMNKGDPLIGTIDKDGVAYLPVDPKTKEVLPQYRYLLEKYENQEQPPIDLKIEEKEIENGADGDKILEVKTDNVVYPPGIDKEDIVNEGNENEGQILGANVIGGGARPLPDGDEEKPQRPPSLPPIPEGDMAEEEMEKLAEQLEKQMEDNEKYQEEHAEEKDETKEDEEQQRPDIGGGAVPSVASTPKPSSSNRLMSIYVALMVLFLIGLLL